MCILILNFEFRLNTDLHSPSMRKEKRMSEEDFIKNLSGINNGNDLDQTMLSNIYNRVKKSEFKANDDHINQVRERGQRLRTVISSRAGPGRISFGPCIPGSWIIFAIKPFHVFFRF